MPLRAALKTRKRKKKNPSRGRGVSDKAKKKEAGKIKKRLKKEIGEGEKGERRERNRLCFGLCCEVRFLLPTASVYRSFLRVHGAPPRASHLEREIACGGSGNGAAAALRCPPPTTMLPGPEGTWEERKGDDAFVLVASEELTLDSTAFDVLFEPCERFSIVGLHRTTEIRPLLMLIVVASSQGDR